MLSALQNPFRSRWIHTAPDASPRLNWQNLCAITFLSRPRKSSRPCACGDLSIERPQPTDTSVARVMVSPGKKPTKRSLCALPPEYSPPFGVPRLRGLGELKTPPEGGTPNFKHEDE